MDCANRTYILPEWALEDGYVPVRKAIKGYLEIDDNQELVDDEDSTSMEYTHNGLRFERKLVKFNNKGYKVNFSCCYSHKWFAPFLTDIRL